MKIYAENYYVSKLKYFSCLSEKGEVRIVL